MGQYDFYKICTSVAIDWLMKTAEENGSSVQAPRQLTSESFAPVRDTQRRPKSKARNTLRDANISPALFATSSSFKMKRYAVPSSTLLRQARFLQDAGTTSIMPRRVLKAFKNAIKIRTQYTRRSEKQGLPQEENEAHAHFTNVLEQVLDIVLPCVSVQQRTQSTGVAGEAAQYDEEPAVNLFDTLRISKDQNVTTDSENEDPWSEDSSTLRGKEAHPIQHTIQYEAEVNPLEDAKFDFYCFSKDVTELNAYVSERWCDYHAGKIWLPVVALITELAVELIRIAEWNFRQRVAQHGVEWSDWGADSEMEWRSAYSSLIFIRGLFMAGHKGYPLPAVPLGGRDEKNINHFDPEWVSEDQFLVQWMMELSLEVDSRKSYGRDYKEPLSSSSLDQTSATLQPINEGGQLQYSAVMTAKLLHSIRAKLGKDVKTPYRQLMELVCGIDVESLRSKLTELECEATSDHNVHLERLHTLCSWTRHWPTPLDRYRCLRSLPETHPFSGDHRDMWRILDAPINQKREFLEQWDRMPDPAGHPERRAQYKQDFIAPSEDAYFFRTENPVVSSTLATHIIIQSMKIGIDAAESTPQLAMMCHIYHCLRYYGYMDRPWPVLDRVIQSHVHTLFRGELPTDIRAMAARFAYAMGVPDQISGSVRRGESLDGLVSRRCRWEAKSWKLPPVLQALLGYLQDEESLRRVLYRIDEEMARSSTQAEASSKTMSGKKGVNPSTYERRISLVDDIGATAFLKAFRTRVEAEFVQFDVDYIALTSACKSLFKKIYPVVARILDEDVTETESPRHALITTLAVIEAIRLADDRGACGGDGASTPPLVRIISRALENFVESGPTALIKLHSCEKGIPSLVCPCRKKPSA